MLRLHFDKTKAANILTQNYRNAVLVWGTAVIQRNHREDVVIRVFRRSVNVQAYYYMLIRISNISVEDSIFSVNYLVKLLPINLICIRVYSYKETFSRIPFVNVPIDNNPILTSTPLDLFVALVSHLIQNQWNSAHEVYVNALWSFLQTKYRKQINEWYAHCMVLYLNLSMLCADKLML